MTSKKRGKDPLESEVHAHCEKSFAVHQCVFCTWESQSPSSADQVLINPVCDQFVHVSEPRNKNLDFSLENLNLVIFSFLLFPGRFSRIFVLALAMNQKICACFSWEKKF